MTSGSRPTARSASRSGRAHLHGRRPDSTSRWRARPASRPRSARSTTPTATRRRPASSATSAPRSAIRRHPAIPASSSGSASTCSFRPWLDAGDAESATVTISDRQPPAAVLETTAASATGGWRRRGRWRRERSPRSQPAGVRSIRCGNFNGAASAAIDPRGDRGRPAGALQPVGVPAGWSRGRAGGAAPCRALRECDRRGRRQGRDARRHARDGPICAVAAGATWSRGLAGDDCLRGGRGRDRDLRRPRRRRHPCAARRGGRDPVAAAADGPRRPSGRGDRVRGCERRSRYASSVTSPADDGGGQTRFLDRRRRARRGARRRARPRLRAGRRAARCGRGRGDGHLGRDRARDAADGAAERRPQTIDELQAASAVGPGVAVSRLRDAAAERRHPRGAGAAHVASTSRCGCTTSTPARRCARLLAWRVVPVVNENDTTATDEITFGDNDFLSAQLALLLERAAARAAHRHRPGCTRPTRGRDPARERVAEVDELRASSSGYEIGDRTSLYGSGGMRSKVAAAEMASAAGIPAVICDGSAAGIAAGGRRAARTSARASPPIASARPRSSSGCATRSRRAGG